MVFTPALPALRLRFATVVSNEFNESNESAESNESGESNESAESDEKIKLSRRLQCTDFEGGSLCGRA